MRSSLLSIVLLLGGAIILNSCQKSGGGPAVQVVDFESLVVPSAGYWNGSDGTGFFVAGPLKFGNEYTAAWGTWDGFVYSQKNDFTTAGYANEYSVVDPSNLKNKFAIFYPSFSGDIYAIFSDNLDHTIESMDLCNNTYAALSMKNGDGYSKKFGGASGTDPDWFKVTITGYDHGNVKKGSIDFYLADFRFADTAKDYIITRWTTVDLSSLGKVNKVTFSFSSSDTGAYGINTPTYLCIDNLKYLEDQVIL